MNLPLMIALLATAFFAGCGTRRHVMALQTPAFCEQEIRTRSWSESNSPPIVLQEFSTVHFRERGDLAIVKYGPRDQKLVTCLDLYRPRAVLMDEPQKEFVLLWHDRGPGVVTSVIPMERDKHVSIFITREFTPPGEPHRRGIRYSVQYNADLSVDASPELGSWEVR